MHERGDESARPPTAAEIQMAGPWPTLAANLPATSEPISPPIAEVDEIRPMTPGERCRSRASSR